MEKLNHESSLSNKGYSTSHDNLKEPRHRWYYYKEGFSNKLVSHAIEEAELDANDLILDPFNGSGTVNLCASQKNIKSVGIEVNPFAFFLSKVKHTNPSKKYIDDGIKKDFDIILKGINREKESPFLNFSTFSELSGKGKWLFNSSVLNSFEGGYDELRKINKNYSNLFKLALINAAMDNCNAKKDGKCLRYSDYWYLNDFDKHSFINSFVKQFDAIAEDLKTDFLPTKPALHNYDSRIFLKDNFIPYKLCITSPPYLNSFDYTDVYRPELFLGRFIKDQQRLIDLRKRTLCSHTNVYSKSTSYQCSSLLYKKIISQLSGHSANFWHNNLPLMVQSYFEQMENILRYLFLMAKKDSQLWMVVANSAYFNFEIPTDLILADIGSTVGWKLKEIRVLREVFKRGSKYSPDINSLRESAIVFKKE